jgi:acetyl esterase/lipase
MKPLLLVVAAIVLCGFVQTTTRAQPAAQDAGTAEARFCVVDVGHGNAVFVTAPSGEVMLLDTGSSRAANRVLAFIEQHGIGKIDYLLVSHFEDDHMGAAPAIAAKVPIGCFVDHGECVTYGKDDNWWQERRRPSFKPGLAKRNDDGYDAYRKARSGSRHLVVKPGDRVPIKGLDVIVVTAAGKAITQPLPGGGIANPGCPSTDRRAVDDAEDGQSVGVVVQHGMFRFVDLGDLTWSVSAALFCPKNLVGTVDAYVVTHHGQSLPRELGEYYYGISSCPPAEVLGLSPRVAVLTMGAVGHLHGNADAMKTVHSVLGLDLWQTNFIREGGEKDHNGPEQMIANLGTRSEKVPSIELAARTDGSFAVTNSRNGYTKKYPPRPERVANAAEKPGRIAPTHANLKYGPHERNVLDLWKAKSDAPTPVLVFFHGGGYRGGDKSQFNSQLLEGCLAAGISCVSANYRLCPEVVYPAPMLDGARAVQYVRQNAGQWNLDPARIAAGGSSAGTQIALWIGYHADRADPKSADPVARQSSRLRCVLALQMTWPVDPRDIPKIAPLTAEDGAGIKPLFGLPAEWNWEKDRADAALDAKLKDAALVNHVTKDGPPVFIFHQASGNPPHNIHHPAFGKYLKKILDAQGIDCVHRVGSDYANASASCRDMVAFLKKHFGMR